jgi:hypothetical protein
VGPLILDGADQDLEDIPSTREHPRIGDGLSGHEAVAEANPLARTGIGTLAIDVIGRCRVEPRQGDRWSLGASISG